jgi:ATP-dependent Clp protease ATP-binding subunit ClpC
LAEKAEKSDSWVFLFDEIEKAHHRFYDFLLSLLDEGTCTDNMGRTLDFTNSIFIFTSNAGVSSIKGDSKLGFGDTVETYEGSKDKVEKAIKTQFSPEFMNRIDAFIFFNSLKKKDLKKIASLSLVGIPIKRLKSLLDFIVDNSYSEEYGARNINRFIKNNVALKIADEILKKNVPKKKGNLYTPKIVDNELVIVDTKKYGEDSITSGI